jgi:AraC-like DNA-binding protein
MTTKARERGFLLTEASLKLFEEKKCELDLTLEGIADKANMSIDSVKRLFNPHKGVGVQKDTIHAIAKVLEIKLADIKVNSSKEVAEKGPSAKSFALQILLSDILVWGILEVGDILQKAQGGISVTQMALHNIQAENIKLGSITQES